MYKAIKLSCILMLSVCVCGAQTKRIFHKSHSGSASTFSHILEENPLEVTSSNFGAAPEKYESSAQLDSLIAINDSAVIMVTSCFRGNTQYAESFWRPGRDTVYNHPVFFKANPVDSIKKVLTNEYKFRNSKRTIKFIGFEPRLQKGEINGLMTWLISLVIIGAFLTNAFAERKKLEFKQFTHLK